MLESENARFPHSAVPDEPLVTELSEMSGQGPGACNLARNGHGEVKFAHPSEAEFARILDFYGMKWSYEPRSFPLRWEGDRIVETSTPDFYIPGLDLYVELTTLRRKLVTEKNRKLRQLRELYPGINIKLL